MIRRTILRYAYPTTLLLLVGGIILVGGFLAVVAVPDLVSTAVVTAPSLAPGASTAPSSTPESAMAKSPIGIAIPANADCNACHLTTTGTVGVRDIPKLGHPLQGFTDCTACHNPSGLVKTAPGHSSLHKTDCLICHQENPAVGTASVGPMRPEHMGTTQPCTACHGVDQHAPLPADMAGRGDNCWICHNGPEYQYLFSSASPGSSASPAAPASPGSSASPAASGAPTGYRLDPAAATGRTP